MSFPCKEYCQHCGKHLNEYYAVKGKFHLDQNQKQPEFLTVKRIQIVLVSTELFVNLVRLMVKVRVIMAFGLRNISSLDLLLKKRIDLSTNLAVSLMKQTCFIPKRQTVFQDFQPQVERDSSQYLTFFLKPNLLINVNLLSAWDKTEVSLQSEDMMSLFMQILMKEQNGSPLINRCLIIKFLFRKSKLVDQNFLILPPQVLLTQEQHLLT